MHMERDDGFTDWQSDRSICLRACLQGNEATQEQQSMIDQVDREREETKNYCKISQVFEDA